MTFDARVADVLRREGGYVNHPADRGNATNYGITQRTYTMWRNDNGLGYMDVRNITKDEAKAIYKANYWDAAKCGELPEEIQAIHFDTAVNSGVSRAAKMLQEAAKVKQDGAIGPVTLAAARIDPELLKQRYIVARYRFYGEIVNRDRSQLAFIVGWLNRMKEFT